MVAARQSWRGRRKVTRSRFEYEGDTLQQEEAVLDYLSDSSYDLRVPYLSSPIGRSPGRTTGWGLASRKSILLHTPHSYIKVSTASSPSYPILYALLSFQRLIS